MLDINPPVISFTNIFSYLVGWLSVMSMVSFAVGASIFIKLLGDFMSSQN